MHAGDQYGTEQAPALSSSAGFRSGRAPGKFANDSGDPPVTADKQCEDLIAFAKANPEALNYSSIGPGSLAYLSAELFKASTGVRMTEVTYQGTAPAVTALIAGEVQLMFSVLGAALPQVRSGKLKAIAMASAQRSPLFPELPTVAESGVPGFDSVCWHGVLAPRGTDRAVVARLNTHMVDAIATSEMRGRLNALGFESVPPSPPLEFAKILVCRGGQMGAHYPDGGRTGEGLDRCGAFVPSLWE